MKALVGMICGLLFGAGLALSGMTDTAKVLGFLDIFGAWIPDLAFVMGGAVLVTVIAFRFVPLMKKPLLGKKFILPGTTIIDSKLLAGSAIFGVGWGIYGYCPGPALSAMVYGETNTFIFVGAMLAGMFLSSRLVKS